MSAVGKVCDGTSGTHADAATLVEYLIGLGGSTLDTNERVAAILWPFRHGQPDRNRFYRARNHVKDRVDESGQPCCGFGLHYRDIDGALTLVDPVDKTATLPMAAIQSEVGWMLREKQHHTENERHSRTLSLFADACMTRGDTVGVRINLKCANELETFGTIAPASMAEWDLWRASL